MISAVPFKIVLTYLWTLVTLEMTRRKHCLKLHFLFSAGAVHHNPTLCGFYTRIKWQFVGMVSCTVHTSSKFAASSDSRTLQ